MDSPRLSESLSETLALFDGSGTPLTTAEVAEDLEVGRRSTYDRLERLVDLGELETKKVGASARIWWRPLVATDDDDATDTSGPTDSAGTDGAPTSAAPAADATGVAGAILGAIDQGVFVLDEDQYLAWVNDACAELLGYEPDDLRGVHCSHIFESSRTDGISALCDQVGALAAPGDAGSNGGTANRATFDIEACRADGSRFSAEVRFTVARTGTGSPTTVGVIKNVTDREARERELEQYETIVETIDDGVYVMDETGNFLMVNQAYADMVGYDREELIGMPGSMVVDEETASRAADIHRKLTSEDADTARLEAELSSGDGQPIIAEATFAIVDPSGDAIGATNVDAIGDRDADAGAGDESSDDAVAERRGQRPRIGVVRDVTERTQRERELRERVRQQEVVAALGRRALEDRDLDTLMDEATATVADTLDAAYCKVLDLDADDGRLLLRQGVGWDDGLVGSATVSAHDDDSQAGYTLATDEAVVVEDLETETRFSGPDLLTDHGVRSGISTIIGPPDEPWGILGVHDTRQREFSEHDVTFLQSVAHVIASAVARNEHERALVRQREQLEALNNLNAVVREIMNAVIDQSTREEIETTVCERLAETDSYRFAWIGEGDVASQTVAVRAQAGVEGFLDDTEVSVDPDEERGAGPTGRALRTGEVQTMQDVRGDEQYGPWRENATEYDIESSVAVPITYDDTVYGVLNVYADRQHAFEEQELDVIAQLGEVVAHAIAAADRKRALMGDEVVEVEFQILDLFEELSLDAAGEGTITLGHAIPLGDEEFVLYGTASPDAVDTLHALVDTVPSWEAVTIRESDDGVRFELHLVEAPVLSVVASLGGSVERAVIEDGDYFMTVHLSPSVEVRTLIDAVTDAYPRAEMVKRRQVERADRGERAREVLHDDITDRQRTALEAAYHAGFFEWPRETSGEEVANALGISPSTFHQHLRRAEQKIFMSLLAGGLAEP